MNRKVMPSKFFLFPRIQGTENWHSSTTLIALAPTDTHLCAWATPMTAATSMLAETGIVQWTRRWSQKLEFLGCHEATMRL